MIFFYDTMIILTVFEHYKIHKKYNNILYNKPALTKGFYYQRNAVLCNPPSYLSINQTSI